MSRARHNASEGTTRRLVLATLALLLIGFTATWFYLQHAHGQIRSSSFTTLQRVTVGHDDYSVAATIAVRTSNADLRWAGQNRAALETEFQRLLYELDPAQARAPGGLQAFQQTLAARMNEGLRTDKIRQVVLTGFLISEH